MGVKKDEDKAEFDTSVVLRVERKAVESSLKHLKQEELQ